MERPKNKNRRSNGGLALDGCHRLGRHNIQPIDGASVSRGDVGKEK